MNEKHFFVDYLVLSKTLPKFACKIDGVAEGIKRLDFRH
jgi:hypothetical protein